ncbi:MAG: fibronectin type III domain-containing protein [Flavobacteriales bacterium]|nr:fibronectin type III domain-containing protein [Flavobacteriales bacterium]
MARVKLGFSRFSITVKILRARMIVQSMTGNPNFSTLPPEIDLPVIADAIDLLEKTAQAAIKGGTDKNLAKYLADATLVGLMSKLQDYVQVASNGDPLVIESSGMEVRRERVPAVLLDAVNNPDATVGKNAGEVLVTWDGLAGSKGYVVEMKLPANAIPQAIPDGGNTDVMLPSAAASEWVRIDTVTKSRLVVQGLETGQVYSFRIAAFNAAGQGAYSQTVSSVAK